MITALTVLVGLAVMLSGPAFDGWRVELKAARRARLDFPRARVTFLLPSACSERDQVEPGADPGPGR